MNKKHIGFLSFVLPILKEKYREGANMGHLLFDYNKKTKNKITVDELHSIYDLYDGIYFSLKRSRDWAYAKPIVIEIIDTHKSLFEYLRYRERQTKAQTTKANWITITPIAISVIALISTLIFSTLSIILDNKIDKLNIEIENKDHIIRELSIQIETLKENQ